MSFLSGKIDPEEGRLFNQLFSFRQDADYKDFVQFEHEQVIGLAPKVKLLIDHLEELIVGN